MFLDSTYRYAIKSAKIHILECTEEEEMALFSVPTQGEVTVFEDWCLNRIKPSMKDDLDPEVKRFKQCRNLGISINEGMCPILETCAELLTQVRSFRGSC